MPRIHIIPELNNIEEYLVFAKDNGLAFEYNEFFMPDVISSKDKVNEIVSEYKKHELPEGSTLHGAFFDVTVFSSDPDIREISRKRVIDSMEAARSIGAKGVVFHTNYMPGFLNKPYRDGWVNDNAEFFCEVLEKYKDLSLYMENMFDVDPELLTRVSEKLSSYDNYGVCFDYAHASLGSASMDEWVTSLAPYVKHIHINDNDKVEDLHLALGDGILDYQAFAEYYKKYMKGASILLEMKGLEKQKKSLEKVLDMGLDK